MTRRRKKKRQPQQTSPFKKGDVHKYIIDIETECWVWQGARRGAGRRNSHRIVEGRRGRYGVLRDPRPESATYQKLINAHTYFWEVATGLKVPPDKTLDHITCDFGLCVNPAHLQLTDPTDNFARGCDKLWRKGQFAETASIADIPF